MFDLSVIRLSKIFVFNGSLHSLTDSKKIKLISNRHYTLHVSGEFALLYVTKAALVLPQHDKHTPTFNQRQSESQIESPFTT